MCRLLSESQLRTGFSVIIVGLVLAAAAFFYLQNNGVLPGGQISVVKLAWLGCAILFWYLLPALLLLDGRMPQTARRVCFILLASMLLRGAVELIMMYVSGNWHPWMGISHDVFMLVLMTALVFPLRRNADRLYSVYLAVATVMFMPESGFAWYMLTYASAPGATVYFVSGEQWHSEIIAVTAICVIALIAYLFFFTRHWLYEQTQR